MTTKKNIHVINTCISRVINLAGFFALKHNKKIRKNIDKICSINIKKSSFNVCKS